MGRFWRKIHLGIDEQTSEIRAVEFTSSGIGDAPIAEEGPMGNKTKLQLGSGFVTDTAHTGGHRRGGAVTNADRAAASGVGAEFVTADAGS